MGRADAPERAPDAYVATLFDQNAEHFDDMLVEQLGYAVPNHTYNASQIEWFQEGSALNKIRKEQGM